MAVEKLKIVWDNLWRKGIILGQSSQDPQHPATDTQEDTKDMYWKTTSLGSPDHISLDVGAFKPAGIGTMAFDTGLVEPLVGEWLYGVLALGKVVSVTKSTGTWGADAAGSIVLEKCEGRFNDNEDVDGSVGGSALVKVNEPDTGAGVDLARNGEFQGGTGGWTAGTGATLASVADGKVGNCLRVTCDATPNRYGYQNITELTIGKIYKVIVYFEKGTASGGFIKIGTSENGIQYGSQTGLIATAFTAYEFVFVATATNVYITLGSEQASTTAFFDEVSLYELDEEDTEKEIDFFALLDHNISPTATIELIGAMDTAFAKARTTITIPYHKENIRALFTKTLRRYWKPEITDPDNPDEYIKGGIILAGKSFEPNRNPTKGQKRGDRVYSEVELTETLSAYGKEKETLESAYLPFTGLTEADNDEIRKFMRECKIDHAFMIVYKPSNPNRDSVLYRFPDQPADPQYVHYDSFSWEMEIIEVK